MKKIFYIAVAAVCSLLASCDLEVFPTDSYDQETFWYGRKTAEAGLTGCYAALMSDHLYGNASVLWEECASPNAYNYDNRSGWNSIALGTHTADISIVANRWAAAYTGIGRCNLLINHIDANRDMTVTEIGQMKAQAKFLRALYYQILITYYDKVPFMTDDPNTAQGKLPRTERAEIVKFIIKELDEIAAILPARYSASLDNGRATKGAALALKARLLLFEASPLFNTTGDAQKWRDAANAANAVITSGVYGLHTNYRSLFLEASENSRECIFGVQFIREPNLGSSFDVTLRQYNNVAPLKGLVDAYWMMDGKPRNESVYQGSTGYENMDPRFKQTVVYPGSTFMGEVVKTDGTNVNYKVIQTGFTFKKYSVYDAAAASSADIALGDKYSPIDYMVFRYADVLLSYAEAKNELGEMTEEIWNNTVKLIRERAGFTAASALNYPGNDQNILRTHIRYERRIEFAGEGFYYNDIRRWKTAETVLNGAIAKFDGTTIITRTFNAQRDYWWPVASSQLELNPALRPNNQGWGN
jgi:starch-binding outer membrane protein, SusD/RagB family